LKEYAMLQMIDAEMAQVLFERISARFGPQ